MKNNQIKELCISLMEADNENEVISILKEKGYWDEPALWRYYGDYETNFNSIGNQQSRPEAALVEKIINSVDARLMNECMIKGIDPEGRKAPNCIRKAVAEFFDSKAKDSASAGLMREWTTTKRTDVARGITVSATGYRPQEGYPCFSIADSGEGQTPDNMPKTFLSLTQSNKLRIPFVQGKFNMGGTGVLQFSGTYNLQLVVSRRNPELINKSNTNPSDNMWGFTIVRRENPTGNIRNSVYTYLAPLNVTNNPNKGEVLRFENKTLKIFPDGKKPYSREAEWGTLIKLYEYEISSRTHILRRGGLLHKLDLMLPHLALPVRLHECRKSYRGHTGSFETTLTGIGVRLDDDKSENLEFEPTSSPIRVMGENMTATIYAFKRGVASTYKGDEGIIFILNGQTHGYFTSNFFRRTNVGMRYIADSILILVDCSNFSPRKIEDLFMNSRDRLRDGQFKKAIEEELEDMLKHHQGLRDLRERRRREEIEERVSDDKPLEEVLKSILKDSPMLANLFIKGTKLSNPFKTQQVDDKDDKFEGKKYPTYFKFHGLDRNTVLFKECHINMKCRVTFETDAIDEYFSRQLDPGEFNLYINVSGNKAEVEDYVLNLQNGLATLSLRLPPNCEIDDEIIFVAETNDRTQMNPFINRFKVKVKEERIIQHGGNGRRKPPSGKPGSKREMPGGLAMPNIIKVDRENWETKTPPFDDYTALRIMHGGTEDINGNEHQIYDFYVNVDNIYLNTELKRGQKDVETSRAQFIYGLVILGLAILKDYNEALNSSKKVLGQNPEEFDIEGFVEEFSRASASVILPIIDSLSGLELIEEG
jgi:hypothetical protein